MTKKLAVAYLLIMGHFLAADDFSIPDVPSSIEIAEVKLRITSDAQRDIQKDVNALRASEKYFNIKLDRANLYFPIIEKVLKEEGVPDDLKFLSLQESVLVSDAVSSANAVGFWQFKDFTAREVGLRIDSKIDERKNIVSSSRGAAKYMKRNNFMVKNWIYAVNAYMTGAGGVKPYIDQSGIGADKITIDKNTHWYVKRFIAHVIAFKDDIGKPHSEGLKLITYEKGGNKNLSQIAKEFDVDEDLLHQYNKWLAHGKIPDDRTYAVVIPIKGKVPHINEKEIATPKTSPSTQYPDKIVEGLSIMSKTIFIDINKRKTILATQDDNLKTLAMKAGLTQKRFKKFNDLEKDKIQPGQFYYTQKKKNRSSIRYHVTQYNETLWDISQRYGVKLKKLYKKNRMNKNEKVKPGRLIWLRQTRPKDLEPVYRPVERPIQHRPVRTEPKPEPTPEKRIPKEEGTESTQEPETNRTPTVIEQSQEEVPKDMTESSVDVHVVIAGESLYAIAKKYDLTVEDIIKWNGLEKNEAIKPGQKLQVAEPVEVGVLGEYKEKPVQPAGNKEQTHQVKPDETYYSISKSYGVTIEDILGRNKLDLNTPIKPGQQLIIPASSQAEKASLSTGNTYIVQAGDTFYKIAREFDLTVEELMKLNNKKEPHLAIGEEIIIKQN